MDGLEFRVAITDIGWFEFFKARRELTEMNFWQPGQTARVAPGSMWVFLLKGTPIIAGCATVEVSYPLPLSMAWYAFGESNGCETYEQFFEIISRKRPRVETTADTEIGCVGLRNPIFFESPLDIRPYEGSWTNKQQPMKRFKTSTPEGAAMWQQIQQRLAPVGVSTTLGVELERRALVTVRLGQGGFRTRVIQAYDERCAVSGERSLPALEAAHIKPFNVVKQHEVSNGILMRADIHKLFDTGYVSVTPDLKFCVSPALRDQYRNGRIYYELDGSTIRQPSLNSERVNAEYLSWHYSNVFRK